LKKAFAAQTINELFMDSQGVNEFKKQTDWAWQISGLT